MALQEQPFTFQIPNFLAGLHTCPDYRNRPINSLTKAKNAIIDKCGLLTRRVGMEMFGGQDPETLDYGIIHDLHTEDSDKVYALRRYTESPGAGTGLRIAYCDGKAGTWTEPSHGSVSIGIEVNYGNASKILSVIHSDGTSHLYWGGNSTFVQLALATDVITELTDDNTKPPPESTDAITFKGRSFYLTSGQDIHFSKILDPETHERLLDVIRVVMNGRRAVAIVPWKDDMVLVFLNDAIYQLYVGASPNLIDWSFDLVTESIGLFSNTAITQSYDDVIFVDNFGDVRSIKKTLSQLSAGVDPTPLSLQLQDQLQLSFDLSTWNTSVRLTFHDGRVFFHFWKYESGSRVGSAVYAFDIRRQSWTGPITYCASSTSNDYGAETTIIKGLSHVVQNLKTLRTVMRQGICVRTTP